MVLKTRDSIIYPLASFINPAGQLFLIPLLITYLGITSYGEYTYLTDLAPVGALFLFLGVDRIHFRMARTLSFGQLNTIALAIFVFNGIFIFGLNSILKFLGATELVLLILIITRVAIRGIYVYSENSLSYLGQELFYLLISLTLVLCFRNYLTYTSLLQMMIFSNAVTIVFQFAASRNLITLERIDWPSAKVALKYSMGLLVVAALGWILTYLDRYIIDYKAYKQDLIGEMGIAKKAATTYKLLVTGIEMYFMKKVFVSVASNNEKMRSWLNSKIFILMNFSLYILVITIIYIGSKYLDYNIRFIIIYLMNMALLALYQPLNAHYMSEGKISKMLSFLMLSTFIYILLALFSPTVYNLAYANFGLTLSIILFYFNQRYMISKRSYFYIVINALFCSLITIYYVF